MNKNISSTLNKTKHRRLTKRVFIIPLVVIAALWILWSPQKATIDYNGLWTSDVQRGDLNLVQRGYGRLKSEHQRLMTSPIDATVEELFFKPGDQVKADSILMRLANPTLAGTAVDARFELAIETGNLRELETSNRGAILTQELQISEVESAMYVAEIRFNAMAQLIQNKTISSIVYQTAEVELQLFRNRLKAENSRLVFIKQSAQQKKEIMTDKIQQMKQRLHIKQEELSNLNVRASIDGVLQRLPVELGQSVTSGQQLALVGSTSSLLAELRIPQRSATKIKRGQKVLIDTFSHKIDGEVSRIDPVVEDGRILVEVKLIGELPSSVLPELSIEGEIYTKKLEQITYIQKSPQLHSNSRAHLYQININDKTAHLTLIEFGEASNKYIQILSDVKVGEQFILTDLSNTHNNKVLSLSYN